ncbi:MAG: DNA-binding response regulator [Actinomycetota bacterium]|nr:DNA-binding response regulator [Actinomycetota bacterium]
MRVVAIVPDLLDRSRVAAALGDQVEFADDSSPCTGAGSPVDVVVVDLGRRSEAVASVRAALPDVRIVAFAPHVDNAAMDAARAAGADIVMPRSRFFRDVAAALTSA